MASSSAIVGSLLVAYLCFTAWTLGSLWFPPTCDASAESPFECVGPLLPTEGSTGLDIWAFAVNRSKATASSLFKDPQAMLLKLQGVRVGSSSRHVVTVPVTHFQTRRNGSLHVHVYAWDSRHEEMHDAPPSHTPIFHAVTHLTEFLHTSGRGLKMLLGNDTATSPQVDGPVPHLRPLLALKIVGPVQPAFPRNNFPAEATEAVVRVKKGSLKYKPLIKVDDLSLLKRDYSPLSPDHDRPDPTLVIEVSFVSFGLYRLLHRLEESVHMMNDMGITASDVEQIKEMVAGTPWQMLIASFVVGILHSFFAFLAFRNDVGFWKNKTSMDGISTRSYVANFACQVIIFLKLYEGGETSVIVLAEIGVGMLIEGWKVSKIFAARRLTAAPHSDDDAARDGRAQRDIETDEYDAYATRVVGFALYPTIAVYGIYSLFAVSHRSWLSWLLSTLSNGVYMFGFISMTPQLYINYRLKSVAHLPWKAFMYKAFNTFIDDVFAFAIAMPMSHRLACLRDDVIFVAYLYQRWLYPIDKTRANEFGRVYSQEEAGEGDADSSASEKDDKKNQ